MKGGKKKGRDGGREARTYAFEHLLLELGRRRHSADVADVDSVAASGKRRKRKGQRQGKERMRKKGKRDKPVRSVEQPLPEEVGNSVGDHAISLERSGESGGQSGAEGSEKEARRDANEPPSLRTSIHRLAIDLPRAAVSGSERDLELERESCR